MPKKSATAHGGAQRNRPKVQKSIELVRQTTDEPQETTHPEDVEEIPVSVSATPIARASKLAGVLEAEVERDLPAAPKGSASARLAARRQAAQKPQRGAATLITAEHYTYVRRDLKIIAVLATLMFIAIIVLYFVLARGN